MVGLPKTGLGSLNCAFEKRKQWGLGSFGERSQWTAFGGLGLILGLGRRLAGLGIGDRKGEAGLGGLVLKGQLGALGRGLCRLLGLFSAVSKACRAEHGGWALRRCLGSGATLRGFDFGGDHDGLLPCKLRPCPG